MRYVHGSPGEAALAVVSLLVCASVFVKECRDTDFGHKRCWVGVEPGACPRECRPATDVSGLPKCCCDEAHPDPTREAEP